MDQLIKEAQMFSDLTETFTLIDVFIVMLLSFASSLVIGVVYKKTHRGISYSQSFVHTLVIMEVTIAVIMLVVGSNIARAFSLVGALSIVRFRTAIKDPKDVGFIFFSMAAGMAFGTRFYVLGAVFTSILALIIYILHVTNYGSKDVMNKILKVYINEDIKDKLESKLDELMNEYYIVSVDSIGNNISEVVYIIEEKKGITHSKVISQLQEVNNGNKVTIVEGQQKLDL
ncbi:DUF4956 domain-containing protein [Vallitalea okinawensis]|uniref:DUF4956 domain-containing protein n=1 Tax=Vallitalea okinawensis TaxID=2078660 RepID=UPI000CFDB669|nr:DUF4956 domain-containing protein [Vallitalea okinawensis]